MVDDRFDDRNRDDADNGNDEVIGRAFRRSIVAIVVAVAGGGGALFVALRAPAPVVRPARPIELPSARTVVPLEIPPMPFTDVTKEAGIAFTHHCGAAGERNCSPKRWGAVARSSISTTMAIRTCCW